MQALATITHTDPLTLHFSLCNPPDSGESVYVPRPLGPLGYFVAIVITDQDDQIVYESDKPKVKLKLHPSRPESYLSLEPGYTHGILLTLDDVQLAPGAYQISMAYSNQEFRGFPEYSLGEMTLDTKLKFQVS